MKKLVLVIFGLLLSIIAFSQAYNDVIYLKNGSSIKGEIIKNDSINVIIKTSDGQLYSFTSQEIEQISKVLNEDLSQYGGNFSYGIFLGGGGIMGFPIRYHPSEKFAFEMSISYRPGIFKVSDYYWS